VKMEQKNADPQAHISGLYTTTLNKVT
jgi:hypothetical protein